MLDYMVMEAVAAKVRHEDAAARAAEESKRKRDAFKKDRKHLTK